MVSLFISAVILLIMAKLIGTFFKYLGSCFAFGAVDYIQQHFDIGMQSIEIEKGGLNGQKE